MEDKGKILIIDDEKLVLNALCRLFDDGYDVTCTTNPQNAIEYINTVEFDVIMCDQRLPGYSGTDILSIAKSRSPYTSRIIITGYQDVNAAAHAINDVGIFYYITKPWQNDHLISVIDRAIKIKRDSIMKDRIYETLLHDKETWTDLMQQLEDKLKDSNQNIINSLAKVIESKDRELFNHCRRVAQYALDIAAMMEFTPEQVTNLKYACWFHDIGKIAIKDSIIYKDKKLDDHEFDEIKNHPLIGAEIIKELGFLKPVSDIIVQHHEQLNGGGYPYKLCGDAIFTEARILSIADVFDALTSDRVYRKGLSYEAACEIMNKGRGTQFDPDILDLFFTSSVQILQNIG